LRSYCGPEIEQAALLKIPPLLPFPKGGISLFEKGGQGDLDIDFLHRLTSTLHFAAAAGLPPD
jgi:hypothetical protein